MPIGRHKVAILADMATVALPLPLILAATLCDPASAMPLPRPRPERAPAARIRKRRKPEEPAPSACRLRLTAELAVAPSLPPLAGPGECGVDDAVRLEAVLLRDKTRVAVTPPAILRCTFAEAIVNWVREDVAPPCATLGAPLRSLDNFAAYDCRGRNRLFGASSSSTARATRSTCARSSWPNGTVVELTDPQVSQGFSSRLRKSTCARFTTAGSGSDGYHETTCMWISPSAPAATACASGTFASPGRWRRCRSRMVRRIAATTTDRPAPFVAGGSP